MTYSVKEIFKAIHGEGVHAGRVAVFCRFAERDYWSGRFKSAKELANAISKEWGESTDQRMVVLTDWEPLLQFDTDLSHALKVGGFFIAIETDGSQPLTASANWISVSPKAGTEIKLKAADELKVVFSEEGLPPDAAAKSIFALNYFVKPMDEANTQAAVLFCLQNPLWRLCPQMSKWTAKLSCFQ